jgi:hypothetical protein
MSLTVRLFDNELEARARLARGIEPVNKGLWCLMVMEAQDPETSTLGFKILHDFDNALVEIDRLRREVEMSHRLVKRYCKMIGDLRMGRAV